MKTCTHILSNARPTTAVVSATRHDRVSQVCVSRLTTMVGSLWIEANATYRHPEASRT